MSMLDPKDRPGQARRSHLATAHPRNMLHRPMTASCIQRVRNSDDSYTAYGQPDGCPVMQCDYRPQHTTILDSGCFAASATTKTAV